MKPTLIVPALVAARATLGMASAAVAAPTVLRASRRVTLANLGECVLSIDFSS
jgi:hypothetical protein